MLPLRCLIKLKNGIIMAARTDMFQSPDYFLLDELLTEEHKQIREAVRAYVKKEISPIIEDYAQKAEFPQQIVKQLGDLGCFGPTVPVEYGGGGLDYISYGLMMQELERGDSGVRSTASVQGSLVMFPIYQYGSEAQRKKYLPKLASGEWLGCFGLTEPNHGSDPSSMLTNFKDAGDHVILNGAKMWISNAPFSQVAVVWAKNEAGEVHGLIVERGMEGFSTPTTHGKWSLRASATGELVFDNVKVPKENIFPNVKGLKGFLPKPDTALPGVLLEQLWIVTILHCVIQKKENNLANPLVAFSYNKKTGRNGNRNHQSATIKLAAGGIDE
jgi:glutaryl-CoA dehydrogenase